MGRPRWTAGPPRPGSRPTPRTPPGAGHGTAPVGGTTGAVGEPSSGGEKPVRRSLNPEGERVSPSCPMTGSRRKPPLRDTEIVLQCPEMHGIRRLRRAGLIVDDPGGPLSGRHLNPGWTPCQELAATPPQAGLHATAPPSGSAGGGVVLPRTSGATRRAPCRRRAGSSPSRSVHQWTARAWVPVRSSVASSRRFPKGFRHHSFYSSSAAPTRSPGASPTDTRAATARPPTRAQPSRPASTASATRSPSTTAAATAVQQCEIHSPTPATSPRPYAASAPR
jgi:hypothetical protein